MNLIITGATGFLGQELIKFLRRKKKYKIKFAFRSKKKNILESDQIIVNKNNVIKSKIKLKNT
jgi:dihydrodipicolinate reductase